MAIGLGLHIQELAGLRHGTMGDNILWGIGTETVAGLNMITNGTRTATMMQTAIAVRIMAGAMAATKQTSESEDPLKSLPGLTA